MKKIAAALSMVLVLASCQEQKKMAFVNRTDVINDYQEKIEVEEKFKVREDRFNKRSDSIGKAFQFEYQQFQIAAGSMSKEKQQEQGQAFNQKSQVLQQQMQFEQQQLQQAFSIEMDSVMTTMKTFVQDYGKKNGYSFIFGTSDVTTTIMYGEEVSDISDAILNGLNDAYKKEE
ncbi:OmpH family outer membrane protein [Psychroserpens burtonensis]|uniref:OmpH family outer membrane protein n=1 Tax=Psychroserpens burtonensis TaxID=49278 RepID=A0A5C7BBA4_9FLAO|nr:OmpH family outer membrane protein [Psychroserpens burtonensis]TXE19115.1 OmpH family outer membrane protein [Psychroserpens burtonensis]